MSTEYLWFISAYALVLTVASVAAFTPQGQVLVLSGMRRLGRVFGVGPWGLLHTFGYMSDMTDLTVEERAALAESFVASAEEETRTGARATVWVLIGGCVVTALTGVVISAVLPPYVVSGVWSYETYSRAALWLIRINVAGGLAAGVGLLWWLSRRIVRLNRSVGCFAARGLVLAAHASELDAGLASRIEGGEFPLLGELIADVG